MAYGKVIQIIGPVIDCEFAKGELPKINEAIRIIRKAPSSAPETDPNFDPEAYKSDEDVYAEVLQQRGSERHVRQ